MSLLVGELAASLASKGLLAAEDPPKVPAVPPGPFIRGHCEVVLPALALPPSLLRAGGYRSHLVGKWHLGYCSAAHLPTNRGFHTFFGQMSQKTDYYTRRFTYTDFHLTSEAQVGFCWKAVKVLPRTCLKIHNRPTKERENTPQSFTPTRLSKGSEATMHHIRCSFMWLFRQSHF